MTPVPKTTLSEAEYLTRERQAEIKSEYYRGETFAMAGASREHNQITRNLLSESHQSLKGSPCEPYGSDMRVKVSQTGLFTYPDVVIVCGQPQFLDTSPETLLNPTVLIEVLSDSTEQRDRGLKFKHYLNMKSLQELVLVSQSEWRIEHYIRESEDQWRLRLLTAKSPALDLESVGISIPLAEIYRGVEFPPSREPDPQSA